ncbi:SHOCT domain-containing protein [Ureibacillus sp. NPDC094379]
MKQYIFTKAGNGKVIVTLSESYMDIKRSGIMNKVFRAKEYRLIHYKDILELKWKKSMGLLINGSIELVFDRNKKSNDNLDNIIYFATKNEIKMATEIKEFLEKKVSENQNRTADAAIRYFDELKKLKELYDLKIISKEEYEEKKSNYLK